MGIPSAGAARSEAMSAAAKNWSTLPVKCGPVERKFPYGTCWRQLRAKMQLRDPARDVWGGSRRHAAAPYANESRKADLIWASMLLAKARPISNHDQSGIREGGSRILIIPISRDVYRSASAVGSEKANDDDPMSVEKSDSLIRAMKRRSQVEQRGKWI